MSEELFSNNTFPKSPFPDGLISISPWDFCSFEPLTYIYFNIAFVIIAYPLYRIIGRIFEWERDIKTPSTHFSDMMALVRYGFIVFVLGGYARTFNWIMILSFYVAMFGYAIISEFQFAKQSLPTWRDWGIGMWLLFIFGVCAVLTMAGLHIYLAINLVKLNQFREKDDVFLAWYLGCLAIIPILMLLGYIAKEEQNTKFISKFFLKLLNIFRTGPRETDENEQGTQVENQQQQQTDVEAQTLITTEASKFARIHIHHWQIFYALAFFTRFDHPISQVAGGITLGIYTQGIGAYGPDNYIVES